jgi:hypothetical protein
VTKPLPPSPRRASRPPAAGYPPPPEPNPGSCLLRLHWK